MSGTAAVVPVGAPALARTAAVLGVVSACLHAVLLDVSSLASLVSLLLGLACLPCAVQLWRSPTGSTWRTAAVLDTTMLAVHLTAHADPHAGHGSAPAGAAQLALAVVTAQLVLTAEALLRR